MRQFLSFFIVVVFIAGQSRAETWYCDPVNGSTPSSVKDVGKGDGSNERPWGSFESIIKAKLINGFDATKGRVHAGDTIKLMSGNHGSISFQGEPYQNTQTITVENADGVAPVVSKLFIKLSKNWNFKGITFQKPVDAPGGSYMLFRTGGVSGFTVEQCRFQSIEDATIWSDEDWEEKAAQFGLAIDGEDIKVFSNSFYALENCLAVSGNNIEVTKNKLEYFVNDGIQFSASNLKIANNRITDQYELESNVFHHDGIQGWNYTGQVMSNILIDSNFVARSTGKYKSIPTVTANSSMQGISIFDGAFKKVKVSNNIIMITAFHGVALYGCVDSEISQNTIISQNVPGTKASQARISVATSKPKFGSIEPSNITVSNNIAPTYALTRTGVDLRNNFSFMKVNKPYQDSFPIVDPAKTFVKYDLNTASFDFAVRDDSPAAGRVTRVDGAGARQ